MSYQRKIEKIRKQEAARATAHATVLFSYALRNKFGFGAKRLEDVLEYVSVTAYDLEQGRLSMQDIIAALEKETGLMFITEERDA